MFSYPPEASKIIQDVRDLNIQGATRVALAGLDVVQIVKNLRAEDKQTLRGHVQKALDDLLDARPTEPALRNAIAQVIHAIDSSEEKEQALMSSQEALDSARQHILDARKGVVKNALEALQQHKRFFTHCHSSTVTAALHGLFKERGEKDVEVRCTETRPRYQGRKTAKELARWGIPVTLTVDSAFSGSLKQSEAVLLGADAITSEGDVYNKIGSSMIARAARQKDIPVYVLTDSWKFAPSSFLKSLEIEQRPAAEVWEEAPEGVRIQNPAFDIIRSEHLTGILTELGLSGPSTFAEDVMEKYPFLRN